MTNTPQSLVEILKFLCLFGSSVSKKTFLRSLKTRTIF